MRQKRRDALRCSAGSKGLGIEAPVRQGRRAAIMPTHNTVLSCPSISTHMPSDDDSDVGEEKHLRQSSGLLPGLNAEEMMSFLSSLHKGTEDMDDRTLSEDEQTPHYMGLLPGLNPAEMASFLNKHESGDAGSNSDSEVGDCSAPGVPTMEILPGLNPGEMASLMGRLGHGTGGSSSTSLEEASYRSDGESPPLTMGVLPGLNADQMAQFMDRHRNEESDNCDVESELNEQNSRA